jgi:hypothetical protein
MLWDLTLCTQWALHWPSEPPQFSSLPILFTVHFVTWSSESWRVSVGRHTERFTMSQSLWHIHRYTWVGGYVAWSHRGFLPLTFHQPELVIWCHLTARGQEAHTPKYPGRKGEPQNGVYLWKSEYHFLSTNKGTEATEVSWPKPHMDICEVRIWTQAVWHCSSSRKPK